MTIRTTILAVVACAVLIAPASAKADTYKSDPYSDFIKQKGGLDAVIYVSFLRHKTDCTDKPRTEAFEAQRARMIASFLKTLDPEMVAPAHKAIDALVYTQGRGECCRSLTKRLADGAIEFQRLDRE